MPPIDMWSVVYRDPRTAETETVTVYAFPSGGMSVGASDPALMAILSPGLGALLSVDVPPGEGERLGATVADMVAYLMCGDVEHHTIDTAERPV